MHTNKKPKIAKRDVLAPLTKICGKRSRSSNSSDSSQTNKLPKLTHVFDALDNC